jgi:hypothetical protein
MNWRKTFETSAGHEIFILPSHTLQGFQFVIEKDRMNQLGASDNFGQEVWVLE